MTWKEGLSWCWWICILFLWKHSGILEHTFPLEASPSLPSWDMICPEDYSGPELTTVLCWLSCCLDVGSLILLTQLPQCLTFHLRFCLMPKTSVLTPSAPFSVPTRLLLSHHFVSLLESTPSNFWYLPTVMFLWIIQMGWASLTLTLVDILTLMLKLEIFSQWVVFSPPPSLSTGLWPVSRSACMMTCLCHRNPFSVHLVYVFPFIDLEHIVENTAL